MLKKRLKNNHRANWVKPAYLGEGCPNFIPHEDTRIPTDKEQDLAANAVKMLVYCGSIMTAYLNLVESLNIEGRWKHETKRKVKHIQNDVDQVYRECCRVFFGEDSRMCDGYSNQIGAMDIKIADSVAYSGSQKWYQVICSLSRLVEKYNKQMEDVYYFKQAEYLYEMESKLYFLGYDSNKVIDIIIEQHGKIR